MNRCRPLAALLLAAAVGLATLLSASPAEALGVLVPTDKRIEPLALRYHRVDLQLENGTAVTKIEQVFRNHTSRPLEATFLFPMPEQAAIIEFAMWMNGKRVKGEVLDRGRARAIYESIVRRMRDPGLIEWAGHSLFKARIFPIPANGEQKIEISYTQVMPYEDGVYRYVYPLKTPQRAMRTLEDFTIQGKLKSKTPIRNVYSPTHKLYVRKKGEHEATVGFEQEGALLQRDFELYYSVSKKDIGLNLLTYKPDDENGYFLLMASPKATYAEEEIVGKSVVFVIDTSGSMAEADKMGRARKALRYCVERLNPRDKFNIIRFSSDVEAFQPALVGAEDKRKEALAFIEDLEAAGGTAIDDALAEALKVADAERPLIVFITDGRPTVGETETGRIIEKFAKANETKARLFTFGVGTSVNTKLLDQLAGQHGGVATYVKPDAELESKITAFYNKMSHPVLSDLKLEIPGVKTYSVLPRSMPDLFRGDQLLLIGRYRGDGDSLVRLKGTVGADARTYDYEGVFTGKTDDKYAFISQIWANRQVGFLLEQVSLHGETPERVAEIKQLALRYGIVTPYTSYLAVEPGMKPAVTRRGPFRPRTTTGTTGVPLADAEAASEPDLAIDGMLGAGLRGSGRGGGAPAPAARPSKFRRAKKKAKRGYLAKGDALQKDTGEVAVETSKAIRELKEEEQAAPRDRRSRFVAGKSFTWRDGWVDNAYRDGQPKLEVKYLSDAYFELLREVPRLKPWLSLGSRVTVVVKGVAIVVSSSGKEKLSASDLKRVK